MIYECEDIDVWIKKIHPEKLTKTAPLSMTNQEKEDVQIRIFPNPFSGNIHPNTFLEIFDIMGRVVYEQQLELSSELKQTIFLKYLLSGIYWIRINGPSINFNSKIISN
jgi:hypothetical protein